MWDQRYGGKEYAYGTEPNEFLLAKAPRLPMGRVLCLGEGEGRNAVWLAGQGYDVTTVQSKPRVYDIEPDIWDGIVSVFCHLPPALRAEVHRRCVSGLRSGGVMLLEAYTPRQLGHGTGGPPVAELMMDEETLRAELAGLELLHLQECEREIHDGLTQARKDDGVTNATVNRMLEVARDILRRVERGWEWLDRAPHVRMLPEPKRRVCWLTRAEAERLIKELPEHLAHFANNLSGGKETSTNLAHPPIRQEKSGAGDSVTA